MINSLFVEFQQHSQDYLRLLGEKSRRASRSKQEADELSVMEFFWDGVEEIFKKYESELAHLRILAANEHAKGVLLTNELKATYNELYKIRKDKPELIAMLMARTKLPTAEDLKQDVIVKNGSTKQD